jgi:hypothetical protein
LIVEPGSNTVFDVSPGWTIPLAPGRVTFQVTSSTGVLSFPAGPVPPVALFGVGLFAATANVTPLTAIAVVIHVTAATD